ncbi:MAG: type II toxin-antitoxin system RelB/DinJ family antitoxin [Spirochaetaceae bacterium]|nr:type II toxin-antitoxin system RelB/DinJ family antitoxin [Spirochaetaceae bacterium]
MAKTAMIRARVEPELKQEAEKVFTTLGLSPTDAITLFYKQTALHNGLPFELRIPNEETLAAVRQARSGEGLSAYSSVEQMRADLMKDA